MKFELTPSTPDQSIVYCNDAAWSHELNFCGYTITTDTANPAYFADVNAWTVTLTESALTYTQTWTSWTATEHNTIRQTWAWSVRVFRNDFTINLADENNNVNIWRDNSTWLFLSSKNIVTAIHSNASYS